MTPCRPYLLRSLYEWIVDNEYTPYLLVNAFGEGVAVPQEYVEGGKIVLNISPTAVTKLALENHAVSFTARFGGIVKEIYVPMRFVMAIYTKENGRGMEFVDEPDDEDIQDIPKPTTNPPKRSKGRPNLRLVETNPKNEPKD